MIYRKFEEISTDDTSATLLWIMCKSLLHLVIRQYIPCGANEYTFGVKGIIEEYMNISHLICRNEWGRDGRRKRSSNAAQPLLSDMCDSSTDRKEVKQFSGELFIGLVFTTRQRTNYRLAFRDKGFRRMLTLHWIFLSKCTMINLDYF